MKIRIDNGVITIKEFLRKPRHISLFHDPQFEAILFREMTDGIWYRVRRAPLFVKSYLRRCGV